MNFPAIYIDFDSLPVRRGNNTAVAQCGRIGMASAKVIIKRRIHNLQALIEEKKFELAQYRL